ncbi:MAG TPA: sigma-70 family RNA polymerase sigma factor [Conexibacter sp.]
MASRRVVGEPPQRREHLLDAASRRWVDGLRADGQPYHQTVGALHAMLLRVAFHELGRRRTMLGVVSGPELDDLAHQSADDALVNILARLDDFRGASRFATWAYKFAMFEVSGKVARHAWRRNPPSTEELSWERLPDSLAPKPGDAAERREQLDLLTSAIADDLTERQREVFLAIALNEVSIDVLACQLRSSRNAIYKNLFDARRKLRHCLAAAGHPLTPAEEVE